MHAGVVVQMYSLVLVCTVVHVYQVYMHTCHALIDYLDASDQVRSIVHRKSRAIDRRLLMSAGSSVCSVSAH